MNKEAQLLTYWRDLPSDAQEKLLSFAKELKLQIAEPEFVPKTPLGKQLWEIRQRIVASGEKLLNQEEVEQELMERRGGIWEQ